MARFELRDGKVVRREVELLQLAMDAAMQITRLDTGCPVCAKRKAADAKKVKLYKAKKAAAMRRYRAKKSAG